MDHVVFARNNISPVVMRYSLTVHRKNYWYANVDNSLCLNATSTCRFYFSFCHPVPPEVNSTCYENGVCQIGDQHGDTPIAYGMGLFRNTTRFYPSEYPMTLQASQYCGSWLPFKFVAWKITLYLIEDLILWPNISYIYTFASLTFLFISSPLTTRTLTYTCTKMLIMLVVAFMWSMRMVVRLQTQTAQNMV